MKAPFQQGHEFAVASALCLVIGIVAAGVEKWFSQPERNDPLIVGPSSLLLLLSIILFLMTLAFTIDGIIKVLACGKSQKSKAEQVSSGNGGQRL